MTYTRVIRCLYPTSDRSDRAALINQTKKVIMTTKLKTRHVFHPLFSAAILLTAGTVFAQGQGGGAAGGSDKVTICHIAGNAGNPQTISISGSALPAHLAHGDYSGACRPPPPPDKCSKSESLNTPLTGISRWVRTSPSGPLYSWPSSTYAGTPGANWVSVTQSISTAAPAGDFKSEIQFCLCSGETAKADVNTYRADNSAKLSFDGSGTTVLAPQNSFNSANAAGAGALAIGPFTGSQTHSLVNVLHNDGGPTAWNMFGTLAISKGYWGACEAPQR